MGFLCGKSQRQPDTCAQPKSSGHSLRALANGVAGQPLQVNFSVYYLSLQQQHHHRHTTNPSFTKSPEYRAEEGGMVARPSRGASLLRTSRMFSLPQPLRIPDLGLGLGKHSNTATTPFPLYLSVATSDASRSTGDWGFKRPLPKSRTMKSSTPIVRVKHVDSIEAVTDYGSGANHSLSLEKFNEMSIAISAPVPRREEAREGKLSVFEEDSDITDLPTDKSLKFNSKRWKFSGPWLAALTEPEFQKYIARSVRTRKGDFRQFLRQRLADSLNRDAKERALESGNPLPEARPASSITDEELTPYIRYLRSERALLFRLVSQFLDLAPAVPPATLSPLDTFTSAVQSKRSDAGAGNSRAVYNQTLQGPPETNNGYALEGPPVTHPSAGLSYLRTAAYVENHPLYGPQNQHSVVLSRIIAPRRYSESPKLGIGGFVVSVPPTMRYNRKGGFYSRWASMDADNDKLGLSRFDPTIVGGASAYLVPTTARVLHDGKVEVKVDKASPEAQLVKREQVGISAIYLDKPEPSAPEAESEAQRLENPKYAEHSFRSVISSSASYGLTK